jgi:hypothetical protein
MNSTKVAFKECVIADTFVLVEHSGHGHGVFCEKLHPLSKQKPKRTSQAIHSTLLLQNSVTYSTFTLVNDMPLAPRPEVKIEAVCEHQLASESV